MVKLLFPKLELKCIEICYGSYRNGLKIALGKFILHKIEKEFSSWSESFKYLNISVDVAVGTFLWDKKIYAVKLNIF